MSESFHFASSWRWLDRPPLQLGTGLLGHVVVVVYWRLGCVHSRAALHEAVIAAADLAGEPVAVVAVHVPTCAAERDEARLRRVVSLMPGPVTVAIASQTGVPERLPCLWLLDAQAVVRVESVGVPRRQRLRAAIDVLRKEAQKTGCVVDVPFVTTAISANSAWLPTAIAVVGQRLWLASARQRRVMAFDLEGNLQLSVGSGLRGNEDGAAEQASFCLPVALCVHEGHLVVADAQSHTLRAIDRQSGDVTTWCGTGVLGADNIGGNYGRDQSLSSPAGIVSLDGGLYVSQAGTNQVWQVDPMTGSAMAWLGGSDADHGGGFGHAMTEEPMQEPLGLASTGDELWLVEGRGGKLSVVDLSHVQSRLVHRGLSHPVAVCLRGDHVLVADAWAGEVVSISMADGTASTLLGRAHGLVEPVSLALVGDHLYVADFGADAVFVCDLMQQDLHLKRIEWAGVPASRSDAMWPVASVAAVCSLREFSDVTLRIATPGYPDGTQAVVDVVDEAFPVLAAARQERCEVAQGAVSVLLPIADSGEAALRIRLQFAQDTQHFVVPVVVSAQGGLVAVVAALVDQ